MYSEIFFFTLVFSHIENNGKIPTFIHVRGITPVNMKYGIVFFFFETFFRILTVKKIINQILLAFHLPILGVWETGKCRQFPSFKW